MVFENVDVSTSEGQVNLADELSTGNNVIAESNETEQSKSATCTSLKRALSDGSGSGSGLSPLCKRTFSLDGKDISFENDPWYVGWLFSALDAMKTEFRYVSDMIAGHEAFKVQTNDRITTLEREKEEITQRVSVLEAEKEDDRREIHALKSALEERKKNPTKLVYGCSPSAVNGASVQKRMRTTSPRFIEISTDRNSIRPVNVW